MLDHRHINPSQSVATIFSQTSLPTENERLYLGLFTGIQKNKTLRPLIDGIAPDDPKLDILLAAIQQGSLDDDIYKDAACDIYLLRLIRDSKIDFYHGMTVYTYLTCLSQFTSRRTLKGNNQQYQHKREMKVGKLSRDGKLSETGKFYLKAMAETLKKIKGIDCYDQLVEFALQLPGSEQWVFKVNYRSGTSANYEFKFHDGFDRLLDMPLSQNDVPYLVIQKMDKPNHHQLHFGSVTLKRFCLKLISDVTLEPRFRFGETGEKTLLTMHDANLHPILLHSDHVKSSVGDAHGFPCGPIGVMLHDWIHLGWGNTLTHEFREKIKVCIHQQLEPLIRQVENANATFSVILNKIKFKLTDYDLSVIPVSTQTAHKLNNLYVKKAVFVVARETEDRNTRLTNDEIAAFKATMNSIRDKEADTEVLDYCIQHFPETGLPERMRNIAEMLSMITETIEAASQGKRRPEIQMG